MKKLTYKKTSNLKTQNFNKKYILSKEGQYKYILLIDNTGKIDIKMVFELASENIDFELYIMQIGISGQDANVDISVIHEKQFTNAKMSVRKIIYDNNKSFVKGLIKMIEGAQNSFNYFDDKGILIGENSTVKVIPSLEIIPNNVKASHGSSLGEIDENQIFYMTSRGIDKQISENIIARGFLEEKLDDLDNSSFREIISQDILKLMQ